MTLRTQKRYAKTLPPSLGLLRAGPRWPPGLIKLWFVCRYHVYPTCRNTSGILGFSVTVGTQATKYKWVSKLLFFLAWRAGATGAYLNLKQLYQMCLLHKVTAAGARGWLFTDGLVQDWSVVPMVLLRFDSRPVVTVQGLPVFHLSGRPEDKKGKGAWPGLHARTKVQGLVGSQLWNGQTWLSLLQHEATRKMG